MKYFYYCLSLALFSSCASLYTPMSSPTPFLEKKDGIALSGSILTNTANVCANAAVNVPVTNSITVNGNANIGFIPIYDTKYNPFKNSKSQSQLGFNIGYNVTKFTRFPIQLWAGVQVGTNNNSYIQPLWDMPITSNLVNNTNDTIVKYANAKVSYTTTRIGFSHYLLTNYGLDPVLKGRKKNLLEVISTVSINPLNINVKQPFITGNGRYVNNFLGYNLHSRIVSKKAIYFINLDNLVSINGLIVDVLNTKNPSFETSNFAHINPSIGVTWFVGKK
jgi:hypothetical protein